MFSNHLETLIYFVVRCCSEDENSVCITNRLFCARHHTEDLRHIVSFRLYAIPTKEGLLRSPLLPTGKQATGGGLGGTVPWSCTAPRSCTPRTLHVTPGRGCGPVHPPF